ncbi:rab guanine nucleotide exchange factor S2 [Myotisia sp. PD_48]|nr:rab guanine nucleotide exchange factor S2 [Myotisia sp. PD_48]
MAELVSIHGLYPDFHSRSPSDQSIPTNRPRLSGKFVSRAKSSNAIADMAAVAAPLSMNLSHQDGLSDHSLSTLRDPRVASTSDLSATASSSPRHPDLSNEVASLSDKLIQAINHQTYLDDTLGVTRQELDSSRARVRELESQVTEYIEDCSSGKLLKRDDVMAETSQLRAALEEERNRRVVVEKEKKNIEQELENLTAALFEEANKMVAAAQKEREAVERRNEQLRAQITDTEQLLNSQQEQLAELKAVMQQMNSQRDDSELFTNPSTSPSSPSADQSPPNNINRLLEAMNLSPISPGSVEISPAPPTSFAQLIKSVCRTDILAYDDFHNLLHVSRTSKPPSRVGSGSYGGLNVMALANFTGQSQSQQRQQQSNGHTPSNSHGGTQSSPLNGLSPPPRDYIQLKETRFYKRVLTEDIEPTLRLDTAPGISWLTRRSVLSSICDGGLVIEPVPTITIKYSLPCSLCGERRNGDENARTHRFRTSDNESAQRHPLCVLCLEKMRACCDFVGYLRLIVDGHVRTGDEEEEKEAWEETIRLRERIFWSRMGGGVIPAFINIDTQPEKHALPSNLKSPISNLALNSPAPDEQLPNTSSTTIETSSSPAFDDEKVISGEPTEPTTSLPTENASPITHDTTASTEITVEGPKELEKQDGLEPRPVLVLKETETVGPSTPMASSTIQLSPIFSTSTPPTPRSPVASPLSKSGNTPEPRLKVTIPAAFLHDS